MRQRIPPSWSKSNSAHNRPHLLVEDDDPALAVSDFSLFREAGFEVALCRGPGSTAKNCPLHGGEECDLLNGADVVLHGLDPQLGVRAIIYETKPTLGIVTIDRHQSGGPVADDQPPQRVSLPASASVEAQIRALRRAITKQRQPQAPAG
jgi:hypothetical protein